ncbi:MAG: flagellin [Oscillospiraceae bacterium]|nr:flagellin [Oscillospiraceae bacterium]
MGMVVRTNTMSTNAYRQLGMNNTQLAKSLEKLSSGYRINRAGDDASGLAISEKMKAQIKGLEQASSNSQDGISLVQTAEGALTEVHSMLNRMVELATKSANGTIQDDVDRDAIQTEVDALNKEISRIAKSTNFNGIQLLDGSLGAPAAVTTTAGTAATGTGPAPAMANVTATVTPGNGSGTEGTIVFDVGTITDNEGTLTFNIGGQNVDIAVASGDDADAIGAKFDTKTITINGKTFTASATDKTVTFTQQDDVALTLSGVSTTVSATGTGAPTGATGAKVELDYAGKTGDDVLGTTVKLGSTTYEFVKSGDTAKTAGATAVTVASSSTASDIVDALNTAIDTSLDATYTVADGGDKLSITTNATGTSSVAIAVEQTGGGLTLQVGTTDDEFNKVTVSIEDLSAEGLSISDLDVSTADAAGKAIDTINSAINKVSTNRGNLGALQNRLEYATNSLDTTAENMDAANSRIRDTDMAKEMMTYTKMNILSQAAQAMLAQANQQPQNILQLLQ